MATETKYTEHGVDVGQIETLDGRILHVFARPDSDRPYVLGVSGQGRRPFTVRLTALELERLLTLLDEAARLS